MNNGHTIVASQCHSFFTTTVEPPITDSLRYRHSLYNGHMLGTDRYCHINSVFLTSEIRTSLKDKPLDYEQNNCSGMAAIAITKSPERQRVTTPTIIAVILKLMVK